MPDVELERADLAEPQQRRQVVRENVAVLLVLVLGEHVDRRDELRQRLLPVLLEEALAVMPSGMRIIVSGRSLQVRAACTATRGEIPRSIALRDRRELLSRLSRGPVLAIEIRQLDARIAHGQRQLLRRARKLLNTDSISLAGVAPTADLAFVFAPRCCGALRTVFAATSSRKRRNTGARSIPSGVRS